MKIENLNTILVAGVLLFIGGWLIPTPFKSDKLDKLKTEYEILKKQYDALKDSVNVFSNERKLEKDSLLHEISLRELENEKLEFKNELLKKRIDFLSKKPIVVPTEPNELVNYFNKRYDTTANELVEDKIGLVKETAYDVAYELEQKDVYEIIIPLKDSIITFNEKQITNLKQDKNHLFEVIDKAEKEIDLRKELGEKADANIKNLEKQNKLLNRQSKFKNYLIPIGIITGGIVGYKLAQ